MLTDEQVAHVFRLLQDEGKFSAVKWYKETTGYSLWDAKKHVEEMQTSGKQPDDSVRASDGSGLDDQSMNQILDAIQAGRKLDAVKIYKDNTHKGLRECKEFIETLISELEIADPNAAGKTGCSVLIFVAIVAGSIGCLIA